MSIEQKFEAIRRLEAGETIKIVVQDYGVGERTVGDCVLLVLGEKINEL